VGKRRRSVEDMDMRQFWNGRRVFLTGHTGFKGGWLALWLQHLGARVHGYALAPNTQPALFHVARVGEGMHSTIADIGDRQHLEQCLASFEPEVVFHLAAQPIVRASYEDPIGTYATNVMGTAHLLDAVRRVTSVRAVVVVTSDKCYENREWDRGYVETDSMGGFDPYSSSKGCAELVAAAYRNSFFPLARHAQHRVGLASARAGNVIGGGDWSRDRLVPDILRSIEAGQSVRIRNPDATRPWQHVLEPLSGYLMLAERLVTSGPDFSEGWNFGPIEQDTRPVHWVVERLIKEWGEGASWQKDGAEHPHEARLLKLDISKAAKRLGWKPRWSLELCLQRIVEWHRAAASGSDMRATTITQLKDYSK
jgi:CDP-glucose 4,6-dehydratase